MRCILWTLNKSINWTIIELGWTGVSGWHLPPRGPDMNTSRCVSDSQLARIVPPSLSRAASASQLLLKTRIKFYNGTHLRFYLGPSAQRKMEIMEI